MKKNKIIIAVIAAVIIIATYIIYANSHKIKNKNDDEQFKILTSFYPIYIMTLNITENADNVQVSNMAENFSGCIHDYTLTTSDLKKFEKTQVFIENGNGLESFSEKIIQAYPHVHIIDSASEITDTISDNDEVNAHVWLSIENNIKQVNKIADELVKLNPNNKEIYANNAEKYTQKLYELQNKFNQINANGTKAICLNESLEYLLREVGIESTLIETDHDQSAISAEMMSKIISKMKAENIKIIFIDKNDDTKKAETLVKETGATIYRLDSGMTGNENKQSYIDTMNYNYDILTSIK